MNSADPFPVELNFPNVKRLVAAGEWQMRGSRCYMRLTREDLFWLETMRQVINEVESERLSRAGAGAGAVARRVGRRSE